MKRKFILLVAFSCLVVRLSAQVYTQTVLQKAVAEYNTGRFRQVFSLLEGQVSHWPSEERCQACRLLALSYLATDRMEECCRMIQEMLEAEPYYTPSLQDPLRFIHLVKGMQTGKMTLVTASQQAESPEEAPVPVTVITREMLADIGARTLKDALLAYVPGMNHVESANEVNIAMRGIFSSGQQKILIMLNGHRLNSRSTNGANSDYSISLGKVQQIEVLRGPASSLYGNVALTAVVNIITCDGNQAAGLEVKAGVGNWGQKKGELLLGRRFMDTGFVVWGTFYESDGQVIDVPQERAVTDPYTGEQKAGQAILGGYKDQPSYDAGIVCNRKGFSLLFNQRYCKQIDPFASVGKAQGAWYTYAKYRKINGMGIGYGVRNTQTELSWRGNAGNWKLDGNIGVDWVVHNQMTAAGDDMMGYLLNDAPTYNNFQLMNWQEYTVGGTVKAAHDYRLGEIGKGNVLLGIQAENMNVYSSDCMLWKDFGTLLVGLDMLKTGKENSYSFFAQVKHYLPGHWIVNGGIRADCKIRADDECIFAVSPRISLIWIPDERWYFKGSVSRAFVDAPYFYRYNDLPTFRADSLLKPEYLTSFQFSYGWHISSGFSYEGNFFYNLLTDMIYRDKTVMNASDPYKNAGRMKIAGLENTLRYSRERWRTNWNVSALTALNRIENVCGKGKVYNIPPLTVSGVAAVCVLKRKKGDIWLQADGKYNMKQLSPIRNLYFGQKIKPDGVTDEDGSVSLPDYSLPDCWLLNGGISGHWKKYFLSIHLYNVCNRVYSQGGTTLLPYRQQGRSLIVHIGIKLDAGQ